jgi:hypothetical protein
MKVGTFVETLHNVWYMPTFSHSLLSANQLREAGHWYFSGQTPDDKNVYYMNSDNKLWLVCERRKGMNCPVWKIRCHTTRKQVPSASVATVIDVPLPTEGSDPIASSANRATDKETPALWHQRLGHINMKDLQTLVKNKAVTGIKVPHTSLGKHKSIACQTCIMAKFNRSKFDKSRTRTEEVMHTLHSDITGPWPTASLGGGQYCVSLLDEASGKGGLSVIKNKDNAADELRRLILVWETKTGKKCRVLFTDRGGEYVSKEFQDWCLTKNIDHQYSVPRTPQQNGRAERFNQTIANIMRSLMYTYKLHDSLWGHAMYYACLIYNVMMNKRHGKTRYEVFYGHPPDLSNFRTFGCKVYARVADTARTKLEPKYQIGMFLGPESTGPGYKVLTWNPKNKRDKYQVRIFRDIITFECLKAVTGAQDESYLHWGGHIHLPEGQDIVPPPPELESLTGEPGPVLPQLSGTQPRDEGQLALPGPTANPDLVQTTDVLRTADPVQPADQAQPTDQVQSTGQVQPSDQVRTSDQVQNTVAHQDVPSNLGQDPGPRRSGRDRSVTGTKFAEPNLTAVGAGSKPAGVSLPTPKQVPSGSGKPPKPAVHVDGPVPNVSSGTTVAPNVAPTVAPNVAPTVAPPVAKKKVTIAPVPAPVVSKKTASKTSKPSVAAPVEKPAAPAPVSKTPSAKSPTCPNPAKTVVPASAPSTSLPVAKKPIVPPKDCASQASSTNCTVNCANTCCKGCKFWHWHWHCSRYKSSHENSFSTQSLKTNPCAHTVSVSITKQNQIGHKAGGSTHFEIWIRVFIS